MQYILHISPLFLGLDGQVRYICDSVFSSEDIYGWLATHLMLGSLFFFPSTFLRVRLDPVSGSNLDRHMSVVSAELGDSLIILDQHMDIMSNCV